MDVEQVAALIGGARRGEVGLRRTEHFLERCESRGFTMADAKNILLRHRIEEQATFDSEHGNWVVRLRGRAVDGRPARLVMGLYPDGPCMLITLVDLGKRGEGR